MTVIVSDSFSRTTSPGLGSPEVGPGPYVRTSGGGASDANMTTDGSVARLAIPSAPGFLSAQLLAVSVADAYHAATFTCPVMPVGAPVEFAGLQLRGVGSSAYLVRAQIEVGGAITLHLYAPSGAEVATGATGRTYTAGQRIRLAALQTGPVLRAHMWAPDTETEPDGWDLVVSDAERVGPGWVAFRSGAAGGNTNAFPLTCTVDDYLVTTPPDAGAGYPDEPVDVEVEFAFGADLSADPSTWVYTRVTPDFQASSDLSVAVGRAAGTSRAQSAALKLTLRNPDGRYTKDNPRSPYFPYIRENTPVRVTIDAGAAGVDVYRMYASTWSPRWPGNSKHLALVDVLCNGVDQRLSISPALRSPLYRTLSARPELRAYWPMEDAAGSTSIASAVSGGRAMVARDVEFGAEASHPGSAPIIRLTDTSTLSGQVTGSFAGHWQVSWYYHTEGPPTAAVDVMSVDTSDGGGGGLHWTFTLDGPGLVMTVAATNSAGDVVASSPFTVTSADMTGWQDARFMAHQNGTKLDYQVVLFPVSGGNGIALQGSIAGTTAGAPRTVGVPAQPGLSAVSMGHVAVLDVWDLDAAGPAGNGYAGELVTDRIRRLCADGGVPVRIVGTSSVRMGSQGVDTLPNLLAECQDADHGELVDGLDPGYTYFTRASAYNITPSLVIDMAKRQVKAPFEPLDTTQYRVNRVTVNRKGGSSATYSDDDGPLGTRAVGVFEPSPPTLNLAADSDLPQHAAWLVHVGTVPGFVYPTLAFDLHPVQNADLVEQWLATGLRSRALLQNPPAQLFAQDDIDLLIEGYTITLRNRRTWSIAANCSPYAPYRVAVLAADLAHVDEYSLRGDTAGTVLAADVAAGASTLSLSTTQGPAWTTAPEHFPIVLDVGGLRVTVTAIAAVTGGKQTATVEAGDLVVGRPAGTPVRLWKPPVIGL